MVAEPPSRAHVLSFPPQVGAGCRVLVLGTAPSQRSLELQQSYAHPQNLFWPFMGEIHDAGPELPYAERIARLHRRGVGIWDVLEAASERAASTVPFAQAAKCRTIFPRCSNGIPRSPCSP